MVLVYRYATPSKAIPPLPEPAIRNSELDLRVCRRRQNHVGDIGDDALERVPRLARKSLPLRGVSKGRPFLVPLRDALIAQHVGKVRQARPNERIAVKNL